ncbi:MAG: hypothetical protein AAF754_15770 [Pseudomonadota bacterium]
MRVNLLLFVALLGLSACAPMSPAPPKLDVPATNCPRDGGIGGTGECGVEKPNKEAKLEAAGAEVELA